MLRPGSPRQAEDRSRRRAGTKTRGRLVHPLAVRPEPQPVMRDLAVLPGSQPRAEAARPLGRHPACRKAPELRANAGSATSGSRV